MAPRQPPRLCLSGETPVHHTIARHDREAAEALVAEILKRGYKVSVHDGEDGWDVKLSTDAAVILAAMGEMEDDYIRIRTADGTRVGGFALVYGNGPGETIADYTDNAECESIFNAVVTI
jgi:hypothetical protein